MCTPSVQVKNSSPNLMTGQYLEWNVELPSRANERESPVFFLKNSEWFFRFIYKFSSPVKCYKIYLKLKNKRSSLESCRVNFQVGFKNEETLSFHKGEFNTSESLNFWSIRADELRSKTPPHASLKFLFYFNNVSEPLLKINKETSGTAVQTPKYMDDNTLLANVSKKFSKLFEEGGDHNVEFGCGGEIIKAHKHVLFCHSDVFASMFRHGVWMFESQITHIEIKDIEASIFKEFLRYLYTGVFPDLTVDVALQFYKAADKYAIDALKTQCVSFLSENLSPEKALDILIVVDRHGDPDYKKNVMEYAIKEKIQFMEDKWIDFCTENQTLASEVFNLFCQKLQRKKRKIES